MKHTTEEHSKELSLTVYKKLAIMIVLSFIAMYILMYSMVDIFANVIPNINQFYMAGLMTMPMLIIAQIEVFTDGIVRLQFERKDIPVSKRLRMDLMWNTDKEYMADLKYIFTRNFSVRTHYDSDMGIGFGLNLNY